MPFLPPNQQRQSTEGKYPKHKYTYLSITNYALYKCTFTPPTMVQLPFSWGICGIQFLLGFLLPPVLDENLWR